MKLLKFKTTSGFRMLKKDFEISFLTKTRVDKDMDNDDLIELELGLYYPKETVFIGKNSSGKTTVLTLIQLILNFIKTGRISTKVLRDQVYFDIEFIFYDKGVIYLYKGSFMNNPLSNREYLIIKDESLQKTTFKPNYKKDLSNISFLKENIIKPNINNDTSEITKFNFGDMSILVDMIAEDNLNLFNIISVVNDFYGEGAFNTLVKLFDDSVDYINPIRLDNSSVAFAFKRINSTQLNVDVFYLKDRLSSGTYRGIYLFAASLIAFKLGGDILIDEIEKSFNKNLIDNLFMLFNDKNINKSNASLVYSTHYSELLDSSDRCDNINVLHRDGDVISVDNMCTSYKLRTDLSKSKQFEQNAFDNLLNYDRLMDLRRLLRK